MTSQTPDAFLALSSALTGFSKETLIFALQKADFFAVFEATYGAATLNDLMDSFQSEVNGGASPEKAAAFILDDTQNKARADAARALIVFWYLGQIAPPDDPKGLHIPSAEFFAQGLAWRAVQAHAPAVSTQQFGYWATPPAPLGDHL